MRDHTVGALPVFEMRQELIGEVGVDREPPSLTIRAQSRQVLSPRKPLGRAEVTGICSPKLDLDSLQMEPDPPLLQA
jgi:hypothetical protein